MKQILQQLSTLPYYTEVIHYGPLIVLILIVCVQLYYYLFVHTRVANYQSSFTASSMPAVSVVICARNELSNLEAHLPAFLSQSYANYQVVVVNDCSWDASEVYLEMMAAKHPHLKVVTIKEQDKYRHGKKFALTLGIKAAAHDVLLLSDADCMPASEHWLGTMVAAYTQHTEAVIGYGAYHNTGGFVNALIRYDTANNACLFLGRAIAGKPYMGVGRNLSYTRKVFFENKGFANHQHLLSGDDDLFINDIAGTKNIAVCIDQNAFTYSVPKRSFGLWFKQKVRHTSTSGHYKSRDKRFLGIFHFANILFWVYTLILLCCQYRLPELAAVAGVRILLHWILAGRALARLREHQLIWLLPIYDLVFVFIYPFVSLRARFYKNKNW